MFVTSIAFRPPSTFKSNSRSERRKKKVKTQLLHTTMVLNEIRLYADTLIVEALLLLGVLIIQCTRFRFNSIQKA